MKYGALAALVMCMLALLAGCPKSNDMLDNSKKQGAIPTVGSAPPGEQSVGTPPAGGEAAAPPVAPPAGDNSGSGGDTGGDTGGDDDDGE